MKNKSKSGKTKISSKPQAPSTTISYGGLCQGKLFLVLLIIWILALLLVVFFLNKQPLRSQILLYRRVSRWIASFFHNDAWEKTASTLNVWEPDFANLRFNDPRTASKFIICRISHACLVEGGTLLLPAWMNMYNSTVIPSCGIDHVLYVLESSNHEIVTFRNAHFDISPSRSVTAGLDLFGILPPRSHMPHFATDFLKQLYLYNVVKDTQPKSLRYRRNCYGRQAKCDSNSIVQLYPTLLTNRAIEKQDDESWVKVLLGMMEGKPHEFNTLPFEDLFFDNKEGRKSVCFQSIISSRISHEHLPPSAFIDDEFFTHYEIRREQVDVTYRYMPTKDIPSEGCKINILMVQRKEQRVIKQWRDIMMRLYEEKDKYPNLNLRIRGKNYEDEMLMNQVHDFQNADIVIAAHGASLANIIFMKANSSVVELYPFGYVAGPFDSLARTLEIEHHKIVAAPDEDHFAKCMKSYKQIDRKTAKKVLFQVQEAMHKYKNGNKTHYLKIEDVSIDDYNKVAGLRACTRRQDINVDIRDILDAVAKSWSRMCGLT